ncbi:AmmeMemoRadiSam system protein A [Candidatus Sumerlaeota bacterium]|nr:AmmeMemoRadiSam system protein A [Candidatus Sumerlaeota bacterium]
MTRDFSYSVGYCAIAYTTPITKPSEADSKEGAKAGSAASDNPGRPALQSDRFLSGDEEQTLLRLARATLVEWLERGSRKVDLSKFDLTPALRRDAGVFVTLHKHGQLRGCIGHTDPIKPLYEAVIENAINAAANDWRFPTVTKRELADLDIEISVMSPLRKIKSPEEIVIGRHGLMIEKRSRRGIFLPQVPVEQGWNREQYLEEICRKAELPPGSWKEGAELQVFTAQVFGEKEKGAPGGSKQ